MKKTIGMVLVLALIGSTSFGAEKKRAMHPHQPEKVKWSRPYGMAGCGLGTYVISSKGNGPQIFAATTNGTSGTQIFGITSGTSNCVDDPNDEVASRMDHFVIANRAAIAGDISKGEGETVSVLSTLMGCRDQNVLGSKLKESFKEIFPTHTISPTEITDSIITVIKNDAVLSGDCGQIS